MSVSISRTMLVQQRHALQRAIQQARARNEIEDVELLQSILNLLQELHDLDPRNLVKRPLH